MSDTTELKTLSEIRLDFAHHKIHEGNSYVVSDVNDLANGASFDYLLTTPNTTVWAHLFLVIQSEAEASYILYENPTITLAGTGMTAYNRDRNSSNTATTTVEHTPTVGAVGTQIFEEHWGVAIGGGIAGINRGLKEFVLKQNEEYLLRVTNETASANQVSVILNWYEHVRFVIGDKR